jgi:hypothetical protein
MHDVFSWVTVRDYGTRDDRDLDELRLASNLQF